MSSRKPAVPVLRRTVLAALLSTLLSAPSHALTATSIDEVTEGGGGASVLVTIPAQDAARYSIEKSFGAARLTAGEGISTVAVGAGRTVILYGDAAASEIVSFASGTAGGVEVDGILVLGEAQSAASGNLGSPLRVSGGGYLIAEGGEFTLAKLDLETNAVLEVCGATVSAATSVYDSTAGKVVLRMRSGELRLAGVSIGNYGTDNTYAKVFGGSLTTGYLNVAQGGKLGFNAGTVTVTGGESVNAGRINTTADESTQTPKPSQSAGTLVIEGGSFTNTSTARVVLENLTASGATVTNESGASISLSGILTLSDGASYTTSATESIGTLSATSGSTVEVGEGGSFTLTTGWDDFAGRFVVEGGKADLSAVTYDTRETPVVLQLRSGTLTLGGMEIGGYGTDSTYAKVFGGSLTTGYLNVAQGGKLGFNAGTVTVTDGESVNAGRINTTADEGTGTSKPSQSEATLVIEGGSFTNTSTARVAIKNFTASGATVTNESGASISLSGILTLSDGASYSTSATESIGTLSAASGSTVEVGEGGVFTLTSGWDDFAGRFVVAGGSADLSAVIYDSRETPVVLQLRSGTLTLGGMEIGDYGTDNTYAKVFGGTLSTGYLNVAAGGKLGLNAGTVIVTDGTSVNAGRISTTADDTAGTPKPSVSEATLVISGGSFTNQSGARMLLGNLEITGAEFTNETGADLTVSGEWTLGDGAVYRVSGTEAANVLTLEAGSAWIESSAETVAEIDAKALYLKGGALRHLVDGAATDFTGWRVAATDAAESRAVYVSGEYALETLTVGAGGRVEVTKGGSLAAASLALEDSGEFVLAGGVLSTASDSVFTAGLGDGSVTDAGALQDGLTLSSGEVVITDALYNVLYAETAAALMADGVTVRFTGTTTDPKGSIGLGQLGDVENLILSDVTVTVDASAAESGTVTVDKTIGVSGLSIGEGVNTIRIAEGSSLMLVGSDDAPELFDFEGEQGTVEIAGGLVLGTQSGDGGKVSDTLRLSGTLEVGAGEFTLTDLRTEAGARVDVGGGSLSVEKLTVAGATYLTGAATVENFSSEGTTGVVYVGTSGETSKRGDLTVTGGTLAGLSFFLDPAWVDGAPVTDGSRMVFSGTAIDGRIAVGENSYAVLGGTDETEFTAVFESGALSWGSAEGAVLAAVYVAQPITIDPASGGLYVDGTLTANPAFAVGSVTFAANSALVANVSSVTDGTALITATSVTVEEGSKAVLVGNIQEGVSYRLTSDTAANQNWAANLVSGNALWKLAMTGGVIRASLQDAAPVFGSGMQGAALADAGMAAGTGAAYEYVNALLTDASGDASALASVAARFDAAMNPAGALATWTTAHDRASELKRIVREEAASDAADRLWVHMTGGRTKLDGISTAGSGTVSVKTTAWGLAAGGEAAAGGGKLGAAFSAGTGSTRNGAVSAKDDFSWYGLSLYGRTALAGIGLTADLSATWLRSDLSVGGVAQVDAATTTAVYAFGVEASGIFDAGFAEVTPFIGVDVFHVRGDGFGNGHGAVIEDSDATVAEFPVGARVATSFDTQGGIRVEPSFMLAVIPTVGDTEITSRVRFAGAESRYGFTFTDDVKVRSRLGVEAASGRMRIGLDAGYEWGNEERSAASVSIRAKFLF
ncbi:hypothetical protein [Sutterella sp.]|uniref:hypothetical protein n=1 Tax=Sutterella sp. TaxID=1981025 RepID=UPI0026E072CD|nr:hypothetical protein [Sutterella sp.]MDO5531783.1 hypothetical protein [Sutterella sp.]